MRWIAYLTFVLMVGCSSKVINEEPTLVSVHLIDRNGVQETISEKERLGRFQLISFLDPQPYEKVVCTYRQGVVPITKVISYHKNGQPKQTLDVVALRANGAYREFFESGKLKLEATVIEGLGDISPQSQESWIFDGVSKVYFENGALKAEIPYEKGVLQGVAVYYREDQSVLRKSPFVDGHSHGEELFFGASGEIFGALPYIQGKLHGRSWISPLWEGGHILETYEMGRLIQGEYRTASGDLVSEVHDGFGEKSIFQNGRLVQTEEIQGGLVDGKMTFFDKEGFVNHTFLQKKGVKEGEECFFYKNKNLKLVVAWENDQIHGLVKSWYENGGIESERVYAQNKKEGSAFAWYQDGDRMLIEEYEDDLLIEGRYYKRGDQEPISRVRNGSGIVTLYDAKGGFLKKIVYEKGLPVSG